MLVGHAVLLKVPLTYCRLTLTECPWVSKTPLSLPSLILVVEPTFHWSSVSDSTCAKESRNKKRNESRNKKRNEKRNVSRNKRRNKKRNKSRNEEKKNTMALMSHRRPVFLDSRKTFPRQQNFKEAEGPGRGSPNF